MSDDILADIPGAGQKVGEDISLEEATGAASEQGEKESETSSDSPSTNKTEEDTSPSHQGEDSEDTQEDTEGTSDDSENTDDDKQIPFHKHPRWQEMKEKLENKDETIEELKEQMNEIQASDTSEEEAEGDETPSMPQWFKNAFGEDNEEMWDNYLEHTQKEREQLKQEAIKEIKQEIEQEQKEQEKWENWVDEEVERLQEEGKEFDRNKLLKIAVDYQPTDEEGNISLDKTFDLYQKIESKEESSDVDKKKEVADKTTSKSTRESDSKPFKTPEDF